MTHKARRMVSHLDSSHALYQAVGDAISSARNVTKGSGGCTVQLVFLTDGFDIFNSLKGYLLGCMDVISFSPSPFLSLLLPGLALRHIAPKQEIHINPKRDVSICIYFSTPLVQRHSRSKQETHALAAGGVNPRWRYGGYDPVE